MNRVTLVLTGIAAGIAAGAAAAYVFDPVSGTRRRAQLRDRGVRVMHRSRELLDQAGRDLRTRANGVATGFKTPAARIASGVAVGAGVLAAGSRWARSRHHPVPQPVYPSIGERGPLRVGTDGL